MSYPASVQNTLGALLIVASAALASGCGVGEASIAVKAPPAATVPVVTTLPVRGEAVALNGGTVNQTA